MSIISRKDRLADDKINTIEEMYSHSENKLWESNPMKALIFEGTERRKKLNFWARFIITFIITLTFIFLIWLLFFGALPAESRDLVNILMGAYVAVLSKVTDYWFKEKDDPEHKEMEQLEKVSLDE
jgi:glycerol uptake facilitator-like aquaporin